MNPPTIAFCTTCKGRAQHLEQTLPKNLADNEDYPNCKFIVVDYNSPDHLESFLRTQERAIQSGRLAVYSFPTAGVFRMAHAKNMAHRLGIREGADILVNLDADNYTGPGFARYIAERFASAGRNTFLWAKMIQDGPDRLPRGISGRIAVSARSFLLAGGYDEQFDKWSPDDKDFNLRLQRLGHTGLEIDKRYLGAVLHNDKMRFREYPESRTCSYDFEVVQEWETTIANFGRIGQGIVYRNFDADSPIILSRLATRIFGIGLHKTATTSLHSAFRLLGIDSAHWKSAHWAKAIWEEMTASGRSLTLEQHYALSDLPIPLLYDKLDAAYPGSKFVLTVRNPDRWIKSVEHHWSERNKFRAGWSTDPFTHRVHKLLYGQKNFNAEAFLLRYMRHNADVWWYFRKRPEDLLIMDMDAGAGWNELCRFLQCSVPDGPYPTAFVTS